MTINATLIETLNKEQVAYAGELLENIYVHNKQNITISKEDFDTTKAIVDATSSWSMKITILSHLTPQAQLDYIQTLSQESLPQLFEHYANIDLLKQLLPKQPKDLQTTILKHLYTINRLKYTSLKDISSTNTTQEGPLTVKRTKNIQKLLERDKEQLVTAFSSPNITIEKINQTAAKCEKRYPVDELEQLINTIINDFISTGPPMNNQENFFTHLKFAHFLNNFIPFYPRLEKQLQPILDQQLKTLTLFPNTEAIIQVIDPFPLSYLRLLLTKLVDYEKIASFEKRNQYCKLLNDIKTHSSYESADNIKFAFSQI